MISGRRRAEPGEKTEGRRLNEVKHVELENEEKKEDYGPPEKYHIIPWWITVSIIAGMTLFCTLVIWAFVAGLGWALSEDDEEE